MSMQWTAEQLRKMGHTELAREQEKVRLKFRRQTGREDIPLPVWEKKLSDESRERLVRAGAAIFLLEGQTIEGQKKAGRPFWYIGGSERVLTLPSRRIEVAIFPKPEDFFVFGSFGRTVAKQEALLREDAQELERKLGIGDVTEVLPEVSEITEVMFKYFDQTQRQVRLLGADYDYNYARTKTPTNESGSGVARVGGWHEAYGVVIDGWPADEGNDNVGAVRWVVPAGTR